jgi:hypothetical protein
MFSICYFPLAFKLGIVTNISPSPAGVSYRFAESTLVGWIMDEVPVQARLASILLLLNRCLNCAHRWQRKISAFAVLP